MTDTRASCISVRDGLIYIIIPRAVDIVKIFTTILVPIWDKELLILSISFIRIVKIFPCAILLNTLSGNLCILLKAFFLITFTISWDILFILIFCIKERNAPEIYVKSKATDIPAKYIKFSLLISIWITLTALPTRYGPIKVKIFPIIAKNIKNKNLYLYW